MQPVRIDESRPLKEIVGKGAEGQVDALLAANTTAQFHVSLRIRLLIRHPVMIVEDLGKGLTPAFAKRWFALQQRP